ncbi:MAG: helix-turn-helix transcriptional regulator [Labilithrix sp.]|nr:helix-turn-helix transcriptional regulator [Labilithrix sp.]
MPAKRIRKARKNRGGYLLSCRSETHVEIAAKVGVSAISIAHWTKGTVRPSPDRRTLLEEHFDVPAEAWDEDVQPSSAETPKPPKPASASKPGTGSLQEVADGLVSTIRADMEKVRTDPNLDPKRRAEILAKLAVALRDLGRMTGEHALDRAKILAHKDFRLAVDVIVGAVRPFGSEALASVAKALRGLEGAS